MNLHFIQSTYVRVPKNVNLMLVPTEIDLDISVDFYRLLLQEIKVVNPIGKTFCRIGRDYDGGYLMLNVFHGNIAYSFGINDDVSWDEDVANRGYEVYLYDHTIDALP